MQEENFDEVPVETLTEASIAEEGSTEEETKPVVKKQTEQETKEVIAKYYAEVDDKTKAVIDIFRETHVNVIFEVFANTISLIGESLDMPKVDVINNIGERLARNYPEQHPLIKVVTKEAGLQAGINFDTNKLIILEDASIENIDEAKATVLDIAKNEWVKNDYDVPEDKLAVIAKFYEYSYLQFKTDILEQTEKNKAQAAEDKAVIEALSEETEDLKEDAAKE